MGVDSDGDGGGDVGCGSDLVVVVGDLIVVSDVGSGGDMGGSGGVGGSGDGGDLGSSSDLVIAVSGNWVVVMWVVVMM